MALLALATLADAAGQWQVYANARYSYQIAVPPGFSDVVESDNGDGGRSISADGRAELRVWGSQIIDGNFGEEIGSRIEADRGEGWQITYDTRRAASASWSGRKGSRVFYQRAIAGCDATAVFFRLDYDANRIAGYDRIVRRLVKSIRTRC